MPPESLDTGIKLVRNVGRFNWGSGSLRELHGHLEAIRASARATSQDPTIVFVADEFFEGRHAVIDRLGCTAADRLDFVTTEHEPKTGDIDMRVDALRASGCTTPAAVVGLGGGITMDTAKAIAILLTNGGKAEDYQGWDLVKRPAIHKIGIPTISGTGAEATRTCVLTNPRKGLKLGMNSDHTVFDLLILDPDLTATVPRDQYFFTGMDAYIHCIESLAGSYRNAIGDAYSRETLALCRQVFLSDDMQSTENRERLMVASYLGGCAIAVSYVGVVHPFSAGLSVVLGLHHCVANCIALRGLSAFYPEECEELGRMATRQGVTIPTGLARGLSDDHYRALYEATVMHSKPLTNALGDQFRKVLTLERVTDLFKGM